METLKFGFSETYESFFVFFAVVPAGKKYSLPVLGTGGLSVIRAVTAAFFCSALFRITPRILQSAFSS